MKFGYDNTLNFTSNDNMKGYNKSVKSNNNSTNNNMLLDNSEQLINPTYVNLSWKQLLQTWSTLWQGNKDLNQI
ncbi:1061_t:CDS:2 [Cetraspora pellucida]|uniref:1061_t:CDS:1 n=1 Tax=Cetraspora pellucida TaxID=1433469 RepID=A0A9N8ZBT2_9GLOM|nr:1061_t:CDS:2 [Cetraspora pellucida]